MSTTQLKLYSKPRGAGDQTSGGRGKLLRATTDLTRVQVLVRETLQNSWDAADLDDWVPAYGVHIYRPNDEARAVLTDSIFAELPPSLSVLEQSLQDPDMHVMEIYDRGTTGLNGPVRASEAVDPESPNNFNAFVFDIGTTKADGASGGTFGFGKTATFEVSHAHSVVYWSVCATSSGELEHRIIACTLHEPYDQDGARYTGAHWWGNPDDSEIVPLRGDAAQELGEALFKTSFGEDETGTSILVIDPEMTDVTDGDLETVAERRPVRCDAEADVLVDEIVEALADNAWPKVVYAGGEYPPMLFKIFRRDEQLEVAAKIRSNYTRYSTSLTEVRKTLKQLEGPTEDSSEFQVLKSPPPIPIKLRPARTFDAPHSAFFGDRLDSVSGYLHLMLTLDSGAGAVSSKGGSVGTAPRNQLCLMRSKAEFVVYYDKIMEIELDGLQWTGVFKPTPECDHHFASSEPPTHDAWTPNTAESEISSYVVRRTLEQVRKKTRDFLEAQQGEIKAANRSVRDVSAALRSFLPVSVFDSVSDPSADRRRGSTSKKKRSGSPEVVVTSVTQGEGYRIEFAVKSSKGSAVAVKATPSARTADGRMNLEDREYQVEWAGQTRGAKNDKTVVYRAGAQGALKLSTTAPIALDLDFRAEAIG
ncbi:hypothetical protein PGC08_01610 [Brevibacterium sp. BDJS002]|uniref:hypothetical protein n=1 Tax=Brevibacterium sp. BDJS002 TaxID=3020906 RepID=UPI002306FE94|nr:hypothetical protein [Brevibacterium sp. BDJS002]WCE40422.1 hypothetical protein PGC08_01610 [Brevibacterium sp. BDJS002]